MYYFVDFKMNHKSLFIKNDSELNSDYYAIKIEIIEAPNHKLHCEVSRSCHNQKEKVEKIHNNFLTLTG